MKKKVDKWKVININNTIININNKYIRKKEREI